MGFTIFVATPPHVRNAYVAGQKIGGKVVFVADKDGEKVDDVQITFQGKTLSRVTVSNGQSSTTYIERIILFKYVSQLSRERNVFDRWQRAEWPFEFICPAASEHTRKSNSAGAAFAPDGVCPLPPAMEFENSGWTSKSGRCYVRYKFKVVANDGRLLHRQKVVNYLNYTTTVPVPWPVPEVQIFHLSDQRWQSRSMRTESHSFKQKLQHVFTDNPELKNPTISFKASAIMPPALAIGEGGTLYFVIEHRTVAPTDPKNPTLLLTGLRLSLESRTQLRVKSSSLSSTHTDEGKDTYEWRNYVPNPAPKLPLDGTPLMMDRNLSLDTVASAGRVRPDFKTYNIAHSHTVKMSVTIQHEESGHVFKFERKLPLRILPVYYAPPQTSAAASQPLPAIEAAPPAIPGSSWADSSNAAPPPYEDFSQLPAEKKI